MNEVISTHLDCPIRERVTKAAREKSKKEVSEMRLMLEERVLFIFTLQM
ncbi:MAG: hypothetical protein AAFZ63_12705 [Bacteroidota bacterium]